MNIINSDNFIAVRVSYCVAFFMVMRRAPPSYFPARHCLRAKCKSSDAEKSPATLRLYVVY